MPDRTAEPSRRLAVTRAVALCLLLLLLLSGCDNKTPAVPTLNWYVFDEPSGAFAEAARRCAEGSDGAYRIRLQPLPADADRQREQLARRLAAGDSAIDIIGMDVIWTPEFAAAGWIIPWPEALARRASADRIEATIESARWANRLWAAPFTTNTQLLWYRKDRVETPPATWDAMIEQAERIGEGGRIQAQGARYEGLTVLFVSLLASAGGAVLSADGQGTALPPGPTHRALAIMQRLARSPATGPELANAREDQARLAFEAGGSAFMLNYTYVWPSAQNNAPQIAQHLGWARWPAVDPDQPSRVTIGGINLGVSAFSRYPALALDAAACIASADNQRIAAERGGLPPTTAALYDDLVVRETFPFADLLRATLQDAVQRPRSPLYNDLSLAISRTLHPMSDIEPERDLRRLRNTLERALHSQGLL
ncbi:ABC transporter substrate-binding protein [Halochromatium roseum]|uniref:ABC transporter substrate-binding protein n=1 Tax=Halochromatium roseum TaxID=391920 RepID=UPI001914A8CA|nr:ABC transporter substrate-binding protein [Halochromatium roseum]MBK5940169.1 ABC transporter substrate-binding protein [Halochromatium roseum]